MSVRDLAVVIVTLMAIPANVFPVLYTVWTHWDWRRSAEGRHLFFFTVALAALIDLALIRRWFGTFPGFDALVLCTYVVLCWQLWRRMFLLAKHQRPRRSCPEPVRSEETP